jgi:hypothetical protein
LDLGLTARLGQLKRQAMQSDIVSEGGNQQTGDERPEYE